MPVTKEKKQTALSNLTRAFDEAETAIFTDFTGVDVAGLTLLRSKLRAEGARYVVAKRTLAERVLSDKQPAALATLLAGSTGIAFATAEPVAVAKVLVEFRREYENFKIKGAFLGGEFIDAEGVKALAQTPPREVLLAKLLGAMQAPPARFVNVLAGTLRKLLLVLTAIAEKKEKEA